MCQFGTIFHREKNRGLTLMYIFYFESVYSNGFWYWNLKVNRFDLWSILGSLALIPIHHRYIRTIYLDTEHWRRCVAALTWLPGMSHWNFFKLLFTTCYYFFFFSWKLYLPDVWFANVEFVTHFTELKWEKNSWDYLVFEMSHLVISINSKINFKNIIIFCLI